MSITGRPTALVTDILTWFQTHHALAQAGQTFEAYRSEWLRRGRPSAYHQAYVRYAPRVFIRAQKVYPSLVLASINLPPHAQGKGWFSTLLLPQVEDLAKSCERPLLVENVANLRLASFLQRRGYQTTGEGSEGCQTWAWPDTDPAAPRTALSAD